MTTETTAQEYIEIRGSNLYATGNWDYDEEDGAGPQIKPEVQCRIKATDRDWEKNVTKVLDIRVVDLNDNSIDLINNISMLTFVRNSNYAEKVSKRKLKN